MQVPARTDSTFQLFLTKLLPVFVYPLGLTIVLVSLSGLFAALAPRGLAFVCAGVAAAGLWVAATPAFAAWALGTLERQRPPSLIADLPPADVAIVLEGAIRAPVPPRLTLELTAASDRVRYAARHYRAGKVQRVLVTGGNIPWLQGDIAEVDLIRELRIEWGVPAAAIEVAGQSRNTYENALEIRAMRTRQPFATALLVTSAAHMPRALAVFRHAGLPLPRATTDVEIVRPGAWTPLRWLPDAEALSLTTLAAKEWIGFGRTGPAVV